VACSGGERTGRTATLLAYKVRFFFGPSFRGRLGPLVYVALLLVFVPSGWGAGIALGTSVRDAGPEAAAGILGAPLAGILSLGLLYALGTGVTAHPSEFDFFMTSQIRPREYLAADLAFQLVTIFATGGVAILVAAVSIVTTLGRPVLVAVPLLLVLLAYACLVLMTSQVLVVLRVRYRRLPVRTLTLVLLALSVLPSISMARPDFPVPAGAWPVPSRAFASVGMSVLSGGIVLSQDLGIALVYLGTVLGAWALASDVYIFHGVRPTLSAGFGQMDMTVRAAQQARIIGGLGRLTTRFHLRPERGGETSLMTRLHLVRIWRDGSVLFIFLFAGIAIAPTVFGGGPGYASRVIAVTQILTFLSAILAMNWSYYERENLWIVLTAGGRARAYFRGLLLSLAAIGLGVSLVFLAILSVSIGVRIPVGEFALPVAAPIVAAIAAAALLTRLKLKPSAFSPAILGLLLAVELAGFLGGLVGQAVVLSAGIFLGLVEVFQAVVLVAYVAGIAAFGLWSVSRLAAGFRL